MLHSPSGQRVQSNAPSENHLCSFAISDFEIFWYRCFPDSFIVCFISIVVLPKLAHNFMMACCSVQSADVAFSGVFWNMFLPLFVLKTICLFKNSFKWCMKMTYAILTTYQLTIMVFFRKIVNTCIHIFNLNNEVWVIFTLGHA